MLEQFFTHDGTTNPTQYVALGRQTNPELYDRFMNMLAKRGIDRFADRMDTCLYFKTSHNDLQAGTSMSHKGVVSIVVD